MGELIVTIPATHAGAIAREQLASNATEFECEYRYSLTTYLAGLGVVGSERPWPIDGSALAFLEQLPFTYHLLRTEDGREAGAAYRIAAWHSGEWREWPHGRIEAVEANVPLYPSALGLPFKLGGHHSKYMGLMNVAAAHQHGAKGAGVRVAVLDTGFDSGSAGTVTATVQDFYDVHDVANLHPVPPAPRDVDGHGNAMATLIHEIAPDARIYVIRVLDTGALNLWKVMAGIGVAISSCDPDIVNLSVGFQNFGACGACGAPASVRSLAFETLTDTAAPGSGKQAVFVAATGNLGITNGFEFPAASTKCVAVGSVDSGHHRSSFSTFGTTHARYLMAPGGQKSGGAVTEDVGAGHQPCAGTSVAAAYVSGMLASFRSEARYAAASRDAFVASVIANHCVVPAHAAGNAMEYGAGVIEYSPPATGRGGVPTPQPAAQIRYSPDGRYVYVGGVRLPVNQLR